MTEELPRQPAQKPKQHFFGMQVLGMILASMCIAIVATSLMIKVFLFPPPFKPVELTPNESQQLTDKLVRFEDVTSITTSKKNTPTKADPLTPEQYSEVGTARDIDFTERELNAMVAKNTDLADKVAIDLAENMVSIKLLIPLDADFPLLGGKTLKVNAGAELAYREGRPVIKLKGVSLMGVPMPNVWLGGMKNIDLINEFGGDEGFWKSFADGVDSISVVEGFLKIRLKE